MDSESLKSWRSSESGLTEKLTPKPLRIIKRDLKRLSATAFRPSSSATVGTSILSLSNYEDFNIHNGSFSDRHGHHGSSRGSVRSMSGHSTTRVMPPHPSGDYKLNVRKTRRSDTAGSITGTDTSASRHGGYTGQFPPHTADSFASLPESSTLPSLQAFERNSNIQPGTQLRRSLTVSEYPKLHRPHPFVANYGSNFKLAPTPIIAHAHRRIASERPSNADDGPAAELIGWSNLPQAPFADSQPSRKLRFLNRIVSGLNVTMNAGQSTRERRGRGGNPRIHASGESGFELAMEDRNAVAGAVQPTRSAFEPIIKTTRTTSVSSDLESTIGAFPSPPNSGSGPSTRVTSQKTNSSSTLAHSSLTIPKEKTIMGAELTIFLEKDRLDEDGAKHLFAAVEIRGTSRATVNGANASEGSCRLDIAIVVDNS